MFTYSQHQVPTLSYFKIQFTSHTKFLLLFNIILLFLNMPGRPFLLSCLLIKYTSENSDIHSHFCNGIKSCNWFGTSPGKLWKTTCKRMLGLPVWKHKTVLAVCSPSDKSPSAIHQHRQWCVHQTPRWYIAPWDQTWPDALDLDTETFHQHTNCPPTWAHKPSTTHMKCIHYFRHTGRHFDGL